MAEPIGYNLSIWDSTTITDIWKDIILKSKSKSKVCSSFIMENIKAIMSKKSFFKNKYPFIILYVMKT